MMISSLKTSVQRIPAQGRWIFLLGLIVLAGLVTLHFAFIYNFSNAHPRSDQWRHITKIVIPWSSGDVSPKILWSNHHPNPLLHLYQIFIAGPIFDWDVRKDAYFSLTLHILIYLSLAVATLRLAKEKTSAFLLFGIFATGAYFLLFQTTLTWVWTLVSLQSLGYVFGVTMLIALSRFGMLDQAASAKKETRVSIILGLITIMTVLLNFDYGVIFFLSAFGAMTLVSIFHRDKALFFQMIIYAGLSVVGILLIKLLLLPSGKEGEGVSIISLITGSPDLVKAYFYSLSSAFWGESWFRDFTIHGSGVFLPALSIAFTTLVFLGAALAALSKGRRGLLMLGLMIYSALFSLAVFTARDAGDFTIYLSSSRYATNFKLSWVGVFLALALFAAEAVKCMPRQRWMGLICGVFIIGLTSGGVATNMSWDKAKNLRAAYDRDEMMIYILGTDPSANFRLPASIVGSNRNFDASLNFLVENEYSVFNPKFRPGPQLAAYQDLKMQSEITPSKSFKIAMDSRAVPEKKSDRVDLCVELTNLPTDAPIILEIDHVNNTRIYNGRLRLRAKNYKRVLSALPGQTRHYVKPGVDKMKVCSWSELRLIEN